MNLVAIDLVQVIERVHCSRKFYSIILAWNIRFKPFTPAPKADSESSPRYYLLCAPDTNTGLSSS